MPVRRRVIVHGHVQGVGFRAAVARAARSRGIAGWGGNRPDGAVEAVFEGDAAAVDQLVDFSRRGPSRAEVDSVDVTEEKPEGLSGFQVR